MFSSSEICLDGRRAEHLPPIHPDPPLSDLGGFYSSPKDSKNINGVIHRIENAASSLSSPSVMKYNLPKESTRTPPSPASYGHDWSLSRGHQAKRARVENIIKGITCTEGTPNQHEETGCMQEEEGVEVSTVYQKHVEASGTEGPEHLREFRTKLNPICKDEKIPRWSFSSEGSTHEACSKSCREAPTSPGKDQEWKQVRRGQFNSKPDRVMLMADILKYELSRAVSRSVDAIFKSVPLVQTPTEMEKSETALPPQSAVCMEKLRGWTGRVQLPDVQTEALSLVVPRSEVERPQNFTPQPTSALPHILKSPVFFSQEAEQASEQSNSTEDQWHAFRCLQDGCSEGGEPRLDTHWNLVKVKSKVTSRSGRSHEAHNTTPVDQGNLEALHLPHVKLEPGSLEKNNLYMLNVSLRTTVI